MTLSLPTFLEPPHTPPLPTHIHRSLHCALRLPRTKRWVCDWLFSNICSTPFHKNLTLPPPHLANALALSVFNSVYVPHSLRHLFPPGVEQFSVHVAYVPVYVFENVLVGYAASANVDVPDCNDVLNNPFKPPFVARFAFDQVSGEMIMVVVGGSPKVVGVKSFIWRGGVCREQFNFNVPFEEYDFERLPKLVLIMTSNVEYCMVQTGNSASMQLGEHRWGARVVPQAPGCGDILQGTVPEAPELPWEVGEGKKWDGCDEGRIEPEEICFVPWLMEEWDIGGEELKEGVRRLGESLCGRFQGPSLRMDSWEVFKGGYSSMFSGRLSYVLDIASEGVRELVCKNFAGVYYLAVLGVGVDSRFFEAQGAQARPLAPRPEQEAEQVGERKKGEMSRERMLEERKKRNRLSAARSNFRKQERLKRVKEEVERNRRRVRQLSERQHALMHENQQLRLLVRLL